MSLLDARRGSNTSLLSLTRVEDTLTSAPPGAMRPTSLHGKPSGSASASPALRAAAAGIAFSCTGLHDALFAVGKSPPNTVLDPLPGPLRPYQRNLIVLTLLLVVPVLVFAVVSQFVTV